MKRLHSCGPSCSIFKLRYEIETRELISSIFFGMSHKKLFTTHYALSIHSIPHGVFIDYKLR